MKKVFGIVLLAVLVLVGFLEYVPNASAAVDWVAYNDAGGTTNYASTTPVTGFQFQTASNALLKYADGTTTGVTVAYSGAGNGAQAGPEGSNASRTSPT